MCEGLAVEATAGAACRAGFGESGRGGDLRSGSFGIAGDSSCFGVEVGTEVASVCVRSAGAAAATSDGFVDWSSDDGVLGGALDAVESLGGSAGFGSGATSAFGCAGGVVSFVSGTEAAGAGAACFAQG